MENPRTALYAELFDFARQETLKLAAGIEAEKRLFQLRPGKATPLWLLGHLANTVNTVILRWTLAKEGLLTRDQAKLFSPDFAGGTPPSSDAALYPTWDEVVHLYDQVLLTAIQDIPTLKDSELDQPLQGRVPDPLRAAFPTNAKAMNRIINHDAYHRGQMGLLGKSG